MPGFRAAAGIATAPEHLVLAFANRIPVTSLIDTGSSCSIAAARIYLEALRVVKIQSSEASKGHANFHYVNTTSMPVITDFDAELTVGGLDRPIKL